MKKFNSLILAASMLTVISSCTKEEQQSTPPTVKLSEISTTSNNTTVLFEIGDADECYYLLKEGDNAEFTSDEILNAGVKLEKAETQKVEINDLEPNTGYSVAAVAKNAAATTLSESLSFTTSETPASGLSVQITPGEAKASELAFTVIAEKAEQCSWMCIVNSESVPEAEAIFEQGKAIENPAEPSFVIADGLESETEYMIIAAVANTEDTVVSKPVFMTTKTAEAGAELKVSIEDVTTTYNSITFTIVPQNAGGVAYDYEMKTEDWELGNPYDIYSKGKKLESANEKVTITLEDLRDDQSYVVYAVVESASSYDKEMAYVEVKTAKRPGPEEMPEETMTSGEMVNNLRGNQFTVILENEGYKVSLEINENISSPEYMPHIQPHEYVFVPEYSVDSYVITNMTVITEKSTGNALDIVKGSVTIDYSAPTYTISGRLVTDDNKAFNFKYTGEMPYKLDGENSVLTEEEGNKILTINNAEHELKLEFGANEIIGDHTVGQTLGTNSALTIVKNSTSFKLSEGSISISKKDVGNYVISGHFTLDNGDKVQIEEENLSVEEPSQPAETEVVLETAEARGGPDMTGWLAAYDITMTNAQGWKFYIAFETFGDYDALPEGKLLYSDAGGGEISSYRIDTPDSFINDITEGYMDIAKDGEEYTITIDFSRLNGEKLKAKYTGPIECVDVSGLY